MEQHRSPESAATKGWDSRSGDLETEILFSMSDTYSIDPSAEILDIQVHLHILPPSAQLIPRFHAIPTALVSQSCSLPQPQCQILMHIVPNCL